MSVEVNSTITVIGIDIGKNSFPYSKEQKNDFRDAEAITEVVQRPTMKFVATKTAEQLDLQALHRVRERLVSQRTGLINQIRAFLLERGVAVRHRASKNIPNDPESLSSIDRPQNQDRRSSLALHGTTLAPNGSRTRSR
jgi:transposase